ncbi:hypothetical protein RDWZM_002616 [Blomia tropicalis]|uniref:SSD domain-containing protein n=1 Tax=Blomia tropicalis TaxID=40697 RepID=A0A9Q0MDT7_BLOTA|nr:hypothetical protein RDWZM_002616 [Blomia tropicalis]
MGCMCIDAALSVAFQKLGYIVGKYPGYFVMVPFFIAIILGTGLQRLRYEDDPEYLFSPTDGRSKFERAIVDDYFPINYTSNFNAGRITHKGRFGRLIVTAKDGGSMLRRAVWDDIMRLDGSIKNLTITWDDSQWKYEDMCARQGFKCYNNDILDFDSKITEIEAKKYFLKYPVWINTETYKAYFFPAYLGGVVADENGMIETALGMNLMYFIDVTAKNGDVRGNLWEQSFLEYAANTQFEHIVVSRFVSTTLQKELDSNTHSLVPFFSITIVIMILFSVGTCMMSDWVLSKPWLGLFGCFSAGLAVVAAFGLCVYCGIEMIGINLAAPFLMLGVGMDDAFVLLAAWRRTSTSMTVSERMGHTYAEAAVSITITSLTNFISFMIGIITPFPSVRIFCIYTSVAVLFTYAYHITFFGGLMAYFGKVERNNLHGMICVPVVPKSLAVEKGFFFRLLCTGGRNPSSPDHPKDNKEHMMIVFFRDVLATALNRPIIKLLVILCFLVYLLIGIYGCSVIKEGLDRRKLSRDDSYSVQFYDNEDKYFREYPYRIQIVINETMNYADPKVQQQIEDMLVKFESSPFISDNRLMTESWLRAYLTFLNQEDSFLFLQALNVTDQQDFYRGVREIFLHFSLTEQFRYDLVFNEDGTEVIASRFIIQTHNIKDANMEKEMLITLREMADSFPFPVTIYHHYFIFFDQFVLVRSISIQTITVAAIVMMIISLIFIPSPSCAIWVAFSIISIEIGVIGYMTLWNVNLDSISMINLIMCIGFSVDFSAHISYAYYSCDEDRPRDRVRSALASLGMPIFQGSVSTVLGIIALAFAPSYVFVTFFKTVFLVMLFGATHGILLLPVLLSLTDICGGKPKTSGDSLTDERNDRKQLQHHQHHHHHYKASNLAANESPFFTTDKYFNGKAIVHKNGGAIFIPRPSFVGYEIHGDGGNVMNGGAGNGKLNPQRPMKMITDEGGSVEGSKSLSVSDASMVAERDLGLGTSAEECSESSWKGEKNDNEVIQKQPIGRKATITNGSNDDQTLNIDQTTEWNDTMNPHVNGGYVSDSGDPIPSDEAEMNGKSFLGRSKSSDIAESRRLNRNALVPNRSSYQQNRLDSYHHSSSNIIGHHPHSNQTGYLERVSNNNSQQHRSQHDGTKGKRFNGTNSNRHHRNGQRYIMENGDEMYRNNRSNGIADSGSYGGAYFDYNSYWEKEQLQQIQQQQQQQQQHSSSSSSNGNSPKHRSSNGLERNNGGHHLHYR